MIKKISKTLLLQLNQGRVLTGFLFPVNPLKKEKRFLENH